MQVMALEQSLPDGLWARAKDTLIYGIAAQLQRG
jgi:hypothetical protein